MSANVGPAALAEPHPDRSIDLQDRDHRPLDTRVPLKVRSLLVPLDGGPFAEQALPWAVAIARKARARLRLVMVHQPGFPPPLDEETRRLFLEADLAARKAERHYLHATAARIETAESIRTSTELLEGVPAAALGKYVGEIGADLVVMTTHGRGGIERVWLGSVADRLVRSLEVPLLLLRPRQAEKLTQVKRILVPLDGSRRSEAVLPAALAMASLFDARIALLRVVYPVTMMTDPAMSFPSGFDEELTALEREQAQDYLDGVAEQLVEAGARASGAAVLGSAAFQTIDAAAHQQDTDMVALTTHGRSGLRRMVLGSIADKLVRGGELPILVTRPRKE